VVGHDEETMPDTMPDTTRTLAELKAAVERFCTERDWDRFHGAKDLAIGVATEAAELLELFRFQDVAAVETAMRDPARRRRVEDELADVLFFVLRLAQRYDVDLAAAFDAKLAENARRYPVDKARGNNRKYTEL
jgi:NTP pyrophosphatase (non-canonical NTP hydrolase)